MTTELSPAEVEELIDAFDMFDKNKDQTISVDELGSVLRALGQNPTQATIAEVMKKADKTGSGTLSKEEYVNLISSYMMDPALVKAELKEAFRVFDREKTGFLDLNGMKKALKSLGEPLTDKEIEALMQIGDTNQDGKIDADEFVELLCKRV